MPWGPAPTVTLVAPEDAGLNDPQIVIFPDPIPQDIIDFYAPDTVVACILLQQTSLDFIAIVLVDPTVGRSFVDIGGMESVGSLYSPSVRFRMGTIGIETSFGILTNEYTIDSIDAPRGFGDAGYYVGGAAAATSVAFAEQAVPAATWAVEPSHTFKDGRIYRVTFKGRTSWAAGTLTGTAWVRLRAGSATVAGTQLATENVVGGTIFEPQGFVGVDYVMNTSGSDVTTDISLTIQHATGPAGNVSVTGDANFPLSVEFEDIGSVIDKPNIAAFAATV